jgi:hypothetical protein
MKSKGELIQQGLGPIKWEIGIALDQANQGKCSKSSQ